MTLLAFAISIKILSIEAFRELLYSCFPVLVKNMKYETYWKNVTQSSILTFNLSTSNGVMPSDCLYLPVQLKFCLHNHLHSFCLGQIVTFRSIPIC